MKHIISAAQFSRDDIENIFARADSASINPARILTGKSIALLFFDPSGAQQTSFDTVIQALGGSIPPSAPANPSHYLDVIRSVTQDAIVFRHPEEGAAQSASEASSVPLINAGDGTGEDPTQALAELHALRAHLKNLDGRRIALVGDLKNGSVVHSLAHLLAQFNVYVSLVAPAAMSLPYDLSDAMRAKGITVEETNDLDRVLAKTDAVVLSRVEKRYWQDAARYEKLSQFFRIGNIVTNKRESAPLTGSWNDADEILAEALKTTNSSALAVRMALLGEILE